MNEKMGNLSIDSENIFPIIKKWMYSDHDIFYRELVSNGCDAVTKLKKLDMMGEYELPEGFKGRIDVQVDPSAKTITITDNGRGISPEAAQHLFTPFYSTKPQGQGIGLLLIRDILTSHGCTFSLLTDPTDYLTRFTINFPRL